MRAKSRGGMIGEFGMPGIMMPEPPSDNSLVRALMPIVGSIIPLIGTAIIGKIIQELNKSKGEGFGPTNIPGYINPFTKIPRIPEYNNPLIQDPRFIMANGMDLSSVPFNMQLIDPIKPIKPKKPIKKPIKKRAGNLDKVSIAMLDKILGGGIIEA